MKAEVPVESQDWLQTELLRVWRRLLNTPDLSIDDDFFDSGGDSLLATEFMIELRHLTGKEIPDALLFEVSTIRMLVDRIEGGQELQSNGVIRISGEPYAETPLLFFHGDWDGGGFYVPRLARKLEPELPLIAIEPHGARDERIPDSIEAMAADRLAAVKEVQPRGPYRLGGFCIGAIVALEAARLLMAEGHWVEVVAMVDPPWTPPLVSDPALSPKKWQRYNDALALYVATPLQVPLILFVSQFDGRPWCRLSRDSRLYKMWGDHFVWVSAQAGAFAERLKNRLGRRYAKDYISWRHLKSIPAPARASMSFVVGKVWRKLKRLKRSW